MLDNESIMGQLVAVLKEGYDGPANPWSYFTDSRPEGGLVSALQKLSAGDASRAVAGSSIVAHVHHVAFGMNASADFIRGDHSPKDWKSSWSIISVDDQGWAKLQKSLREAYDNLRQAITFHSWDSISSLGGSIGSIAHLAYHLGAIRQKAFLVSH